MIQGKIESSRHHAHTTTHKKQNKHRRQEVRHRGIQIDGQQWDNGIMHGYGRSTSTTGSVLRKKRETGSGNNEEYNVQEWDIHPDVK